MLKKINKKEEKTKVIKNIYFEAIGKRKTAAARVRLIAHKNKKEDISFVVNNKPLKEYFPGFELQETVFSPFKETDLLNSFNVSVNVKGGGVFSQAGAVRHGITKALTLFDIELRKKLKKAGFLTRDSRMRERKKFGLKRARRAPQWSKR